MPARLRREQWERDQLATSIGQGLLGTPRRTQPPPPAPTRTRSGQPVQWVSPDDMFRLMGVSSA